MHFLGYCCRSDDKLPRSLLSKDLGAFAETPAVCKQDAKLLETIASLKQELDGAQAELHLQKVGPHNNPNGRPCLT